MAIATSAPNGGANWEVEVKFHCGDFSPLREKIKEMGGDFLGLGEEVDTYYRHPSRDFAETGEAFEENVASGEQSRDNELDEGFLPIDGFVEGVDE